MTIWNFLLAFGVALFGTVPAWAMSLDDIESRVTSRTIQIQSLKFGNDDGSGFLLAASGKRVLIATAYHVVNAPEGSDPKTLFRIRWTSRPDACTEWATPISVHHLVGGDGHAGPDVAIIVADADCEVNVRPIPSAWAEKPPSPGSRFFAFIPTGNPPAVQVRRFYFDDACLKTNSCVRMATLELVVSNTPNEPNNSGAAVVSKMGLVGVLTRTDTVVSEPALDLTLAMCSEKGEQKTVSGYNSTSLRCASSPAGISIPKFRAE